MSHNTMAEFESGATRKFSFHAARFGSMFLLMVALSWAALTGVPALAEDAKVNINTAVAEELSEGLIGVGLAKARRIIEYREAHGPFEQIEELGEVKGIGASTLERNRSRIHLE